MATASKGKNAATSSSPSNAKMTSVTRLATPTAAWTRLLAWRRAGTWYDVSESVVMIRLSVPGTLRYRDLVLRVVASSCKLIRGQGLQDEGQGEEFDAQVVSALGEAFNNVAIHGYAGREPELVSFEIEPNRNGIVIRMMDTGKSFDWAHQSPPELDALPESGMGLFIIRSFVDSAVYEAGDPPATPNVLSITKRYTVAD